MKWSIRYGSGVLFVLILFLLSAVPAWAATPQATAGYYHTVTVKSDGTLWAWGWNSNGQLGIGNTTNKSSPVQAGSDTDWATVAAGYSHTVAVKSDGTLWAWGYNGKGQLGIGNTTDKTTPVQVGTATNWDSVVAGAHHTVAAKSDGTLWAWGLNENGQLGIGNTTNKSSPMQVGTATDWNKVAAAGHNNAALKSDGTVWTWGHNRYGELGIGNYTGPETCGGRACSKSPVQVGTGTDWVTVDLAVTSTVALKSDGTLWAWGYNNYGQLGIGNASGPETCTLGVACSPSPLQVGTATDWASDAGGGWHILALKSNSTLWAWGNNFYGQLGIGSTTNKSSPVEVGTATNWSSVGAGFGHSVSIKLDGTLWAWGWNNYGQLGVGNVTGPETCISGNPCSTVPMEVMALADAYTLTMNTEGGTGLGNVVSDPPGINCGDGTPDDCTQGYADGTNVELTATPDGDSTFIGWSGAGSGCVSGSDNPCSFDITYNTSSTATFNLTGTHTISASVNNSTMGSISPSGSVPVYDGEDQTFTITPNEGYYVDDIKVDLSSVGAATSYSFTNVTSGHSIQAVFDELDTVDAMVSAGLVNGNSYEDIAVLVTTYTGEKYVSVRDGYTDAEISSISFDSNIAPRKLVVLPDMNENGAPEIGLYGIYMPTGALRIQIKDALSGAFINAIGFDGNVDPNTFLVSDVDADSELEYSLFGEWTPSGALYSRKRDAQTGDWEGQVWFDNNQVPHTFLFANIDNSTSLDYMLFGTWTPNGALYARQQDAEDGSWIRQVWFDNDLDPHTFLVSNIDNSTESLEYTLFGTWTPNGALYARQRDAVDGSWIGQVWFDNRLDPIWFETLADSSKYVLFGTWTPTGNLYARIRNSSNGNWINQVPFDSNYTPLVMIKLDVDGDGTEELALLGEHKTTGARRVFIKNSVSGDLFNQIDFPSH